MPPSLVTTKGEFIVSTTNSSGALDSEVYLIPMGHDLSLPVQLSSQWLYVVASRLWQLPPHKIPISNPLGKCEFTCWPNLKWPWGSMWLHPVDWISPCWIKGSHWGKVGVHTGLVQGSGFSPRSPPRLYMDWSGNCGSTNNQMCTGREVGSGKATRICACDGIKLDSSTRRKERIGLSINSYFDT